jgi:hypothetical protein
MTIDQSQSDNKSPTAIDRTKNQPGVLCIRCDHLNYLGQDHCERCGAALFVVCPRCKQRTMRVYTRCQYCRKRLRRSHFLPFRRHHRDSFFHRAGWLLFQIVLVLIGLGLVFGVVYLLYKL